MGKPHKPAAKPALGSTTAAAPTRAVIAGAIGGTIPATTPAAEPVPPVADSASVASPPDPGPLPPSRQRAALEQRRAAAETRLASLRAERASLAAEPGATARKRELREVIADAEDEIAACAAAIEALGPAVAEEHAEAVYRARCEAYERGTVLLAHREQLAAWVDQLTPTLAGVLREMASLEDQARTLLRAHDGWIVAPAPFDAFTGQLVRLGALPADRLPACYGMEILPLQAVRPLAHDAEVLTRAILSGREPEPPDVQRERAARERAEAEARRARDAAAALEPIVQLPPPTPFVHAAAPRVAPIFASDAVIAERRAPAGLP